MKREFTALDWFCVAYIVFVCLVFAVNIVVHIVGPWQLPADLHKHTT